MIHGKPAFASLLILLSVLACQTAVPGRNAASTPDAVYLDLRNTWLTTKPADLEIPYEPGSKIPYDTLMDMGIDGDTATIASSIVGDGSMYTSTGGGVIGGIEHENVRNASMEFVKVSNNFVERMKPFSEFPFPASGYIRFYVITPGGVYGSDEFKADDLSSGTHEFSLLFLAGDSVITAIRLASGW